MVAKGFRDPRKRHPGDSLLDARLARYLAECRQADPAPKPQLALPASTVRLIQESYGESPVRRQEVTGHLIVLAFFFLLRVGEYTPATGATAGRKTRRTVPLRKQDIRLWKDGRPIPDNAPLETMNSADGVRICLENQKNGRKGATLYHTATGGEFCPVRSAARLLSAMNHMPPATSLGTFLDSDGQLQRVTAQEIRDAVRHAARYDKLEEAGYDLCRIGSHSLRSGGATALKLAGYDEATIKKLGRWSTNTYLLYIQSQIANLTVGVATAMARAHRLQMV